MSPPAFKIKKNVTFKYLLNKKLISLINNYLYKVKIIVKISTTISLYFKISKIPPTNLKIIKMLLLTNKVRIIYTFCFKN